LDGITDKKIEFNNIISNFELQQNEEINRKIEEFITRMNSFYYINKDEEKDIKTWEAL
jgi:hypothetical protein